MKIRMLGLALLAACAPAAQQEPATPAPAAVRAFDPVGTYSIATEVQGTNVQGAVTIRRGDNGVLGGSITTNVTGQFPISRVTVDGRRLDITATTPEGNMTMQFTVAEDDTITGSWSLQGGAMSGTLTGQRRTD